MAEPKDLNIDEVIKFLKSRNGRATNLELVTHFRKLLNNPPTQVEMRLRFKDIINSIASVCEEQGTKYIFLKQRYADSMVASNPQNISPNEQYSQSYQPYWRYRLSCNTKMVPPPPILSFQPPIQERHQDSVQESQSIPICDQNPVPVQRHSDKRRAGVFDGVWLDQVPGEPLSNHSNSQSLSDFGSEFGSCNEIGLPITNRRHSTISLSSVERTRSADLLQSYQTQHSKWNGNVHNMHNQNASSSQCSSSDNVPAVENHKKVDSLLSEDASLPSAEETYKVHSGSVKERAQQIDMMAAMVDIPKKTSSYKHTRAKENRLEKCSDDDTSVVSTLDSKLRRQWFVKAAQCDYHGLLGLLKSEPRLAGIRDITSGFTALHWASKHGNADVVKLIAGVHKVSPDVKSHGGYTCVHLATLYKHKPIVDLLVNTYGANPSIRDNSGRRADQYPSNFLTTVASATRQPSSNKNHSKVTIHKSLEILSPVKRRKTFRISLKARPKPKDTYHSS